MFSGFSIKTGKKSPNLYFQRPVDDRGQTGLTKKVGSYIF